MWQEITDKKQWNMLAASQERSQFLQSWEWGEFQKNLGREVVRLSWQENYLVQAVRIPLHREFSYWYIPRGPVVVERGADMAEAWKRLGHILKRESLFLRVDPAAQTPLRLPPGRGERKEFPLPSREGKLNSPPLPDLSTEVRLGRTKVEGGSGGRERSKIIPVPATQPRCIRLVEITKSDEEHLKKHIHSKTRYNIRLSERKGVEIHEGRIENFLKLNRVTAERQGFVSHPDGYYEKMVVTLSGNRDKWENCSTKIWEARYKGQVLASNIIIYFGDTVTYAHGASSDQYREVMAPYPLRWHIQKDANKRDYRFYDLGGVNPVDKSHSGYKKKWEGISKFKAGFGGDVICYPPSFDLIYKKGWYTVYTILRKFRRIIK